MKEMPLLFLGLIRCEMGVGSGGCLVKYFIFTVRKILININLSQQIYAFFIIGKSSFTLKCIDVYTCFTLCTTSFFKRQSFDEMMLSISLM